MRKEQAEALALDGLRFLAERPDAFMQFLAIGGLSPDDVSERAGEPELLAALVDFLRSDEELAEAYCRESALTPEAFAAVRAALPGGRETHWT